MKPKPKSRDDFELFQAHFDQILNRDHALVQLADKIGWSRFNVAFADSYSQNMAAPASAVRLMVGLQCLKYTFNESGESVVDRWVENVCWQYFCGFTHVQREAPGPARINGAVRQTGQATSATSSAISCGKRPPSTRGAREKRQITARSYGLSMQVLVAQVFNVRWPCAKPRSTRAPHGIPVAAH